MRTRWLILLRSAAIPFFASALCAAALTACEEPGTPAGGVSSALDGGVIPPCTDGDGDGFGLGCAAGLDCDDADPASTNECRNCATPDTGCACDGSLPEQTCYLDPVDVDGVAMCHSGTRFCRDGAWTACLQLARFPLPGNLPGASSAALVTGPVACNPCNPSCFSTTDTPGPGDDTMYGTGVVYGSSPAGITLGSSTPMTTLTDSDGDGVPDLYDSADFDPAITGFEGGIFRLLPYGSTALAPLLLNVQVRTADIYFLMDTTGSMGGEISNLKSSLNTTVIPAIRTSIPDAWFGVGRHDDYPVSPYGDLGSGDIVFANVLDITDPLSGSAAITAAVSSLNTHSGNDWPESQSQALWGVATGDALGRFSYARTCSGGRFGAPCFRAGTVPIVVLLTDAPFHNGPNTSYNYNNSLFAGTYTVYFPMPPATPILGTGGLAPATPAVPIAPIGGGLVPLPAATPIGGGPTTLPGSGLTSAPAAGGSFLALPMSPTTIPGVPFLPALPATATPAPAMAGAFRTVPAATAVPTTTSPAPDGTVSAVPNSAAAWVPLPGPTFVRGNSYTLPAGPSSAAPSSTSAYAGLPVTSPVNSSATLNLAASTVTAVPAATLAFPTSDQAFTTSNAPSILAGGAGDLGDITNTPRRVTGAINSGTFQNSNLCDGVGGKAVYFRFVLTRARTVRMETLAPASNAFNTVLHLYSAVPNLLNLSSNRLTCDDDGAGLGYSSITRYLAAGTYYVMLNRFNNAGNGNYRFRITTDVFNERATDLVRPMGDLTSQTTGLSFSGNTTDMTSEYSPSCAASASPNVGDAVFSFSVTQNTRIQLDTSGSSNDTTLTVLNAGLGQIACNDTVSSSGNDVIDQTFSPTSPGVATTFYVVVDGKNTSGAYRLNARRWRNRPNNDTWATAENLGDLTNTAASRSGNTSDPALVNDDFANGCSNAGADKDVMFRFQLTQPRQMQITTTGTNFNNAIYLRRDPATPRSTQEIACRNSVSTNGGETLTTGVLDVGTYFIGVDGTSGNSGSYVLNVQPLVPGAGTNENIATAHPIGALTTRTTAARFYGRTTGMVSHYAGSCGSGSAGDAVFSFTLDIGTQVTIDTQGSSFNTSLSLYDSGSNFITCDDDGGGSNTSRIVTTLAAGTYYVVVDGFGAATGDYSINLNPTLVNNYNNDLFASFDELGDLTNSSVQRIGSTNVAPIGNNYNLSCDGTDGDHDAVFRFTLTQTRTVRISTEGSTFDTVLALQGPSATVPSSVSELECDDDDGSGYWSFIERNLGPGTYYIILDGFRNCNWFWGCDPAQRGAYFLNVQSFAPGKNTNETRTTALDVMRLDNRTTAASYTGNTAPMTNDITSSSCGSSAAGDAVFMFNLVNPARVVLDTVGSSFNTTLTLRDSSFGVLSCATGSTSSSIDTGTPLAAGTYYAVVDGAAGGAYRFNIRPYINRPSNETYATALALGDVANTAYSRTSSTCAMDNHYADGCAAGSAADAVFAFTVSSTRLVRIDTQGSGFDTSLSLRSGTAPSPATSLGCNDDTAAIGTQSRIETPLMPGITYYAVVDGKGTACGTYNFNVTPFVPGKDTNENLVAGATGPAPIVWSSSGASSGAAKHTGNTTGMANDAASGTCGSNTAPDATFTFTLAATTRVVIDTTGSAINTVLALRNGSSQVACASSGTTSTIDQTLPMGTYFVVVEGTGTTSGAYQLNLRQEQTGAPTNEAFASAHPIPGDLSTTSASFTSNTALMVDQHSASCGGLGGKDAVYAFSLSAPTRLKVDTQGSTGLSNTVLSIWTRPSSGSPVEVACNNDAAGLGTLSMIDPTPLLLPAGDYYVVVDGLNNSFAGAYRLNLTPFQFGVGTNENAATAVDVGDMTLRPTSVSYVGNTASPAMNDDSTDTCGGGAAGDAYFRFSLSGPTRIIADTLGSTFDTTLRLTSAAEVELNCNDNGSAVGDGSQSRIDTMLPPGTYYLIVDGQGTAAGRYQFNLTRFLPGTATNETLATAHDLSDITNGAASRTGNTCGLASDYEGSCNAGTAGDAAFRFVLAAPRRVLISTAGSAFDTSMALWTGTTPATATYVNCNDDAAGLSTSALDVTLAAGTYYVVVDGFGTECGDYKFNVQTYIPGAMLNETYASAQSAGELSTRTTGVTYTGNTTAMVDHYSGTCGAGTAPDAVFSFTLASSTRLRIDTTGSAFNTSISLRNNLYAEVACNATGTASVIDRTLTPGTYYVIVDGAGTANGNYRLNFTPYLPAPNTNETFATAYAIGDITTRSAAFTSSTTGMVNHYRAGSGTATTDNGCSAGTAADAVFSFTLTATKDVIIDTVGSSFDTTLSLWNSAPTRLNCDDNGAGTQSRIVRTGLAAGTYYVIVDGKAAGSGGSYSLNIRVSNGTASGYTPPTWAQSVSQLNSRGIKVIVVESSGGSATARNDANALCTATATTDASGAPIRYSIASNGTGLGATIATAIANLANYSRLDITARANDNPTTPFDERTLVASILAVAGSYAPGRCTGITGGVQFNQCLPGTMVQFQVNFTGVVMPTSMPQRFDFTIDTIGNGSSVMSTTPVTIVIPPMAPLYPSSGTYSRDFDATMRCAGTEVPRWSNLSWTATLPAGTSIDFVLRAANTSAGLGSATPVTISTPTLSSPQNIGNSLVAGGVPATLPYLRVTAVLRSNTTGTVAPTLSSFNVLYDCVAGE